MDRVRTTDEMDHITPEERKALMGFCDKDEEWWAFDYPIDEARCPKCNNRPSKSIGFQIMSQRTFQPMLHGKKKAKKRR